MAPFDKLQLRKATDAEWTSVNPVLLNGEPAFSTDTGELRIGNGTDHWSDLSPIAGGVSDHGALSGLADDDHPQYTDDAEVIALAGPIAEASATAAVGTHASDPNAHGDFLTEAEADGLYDALGAAATAEANAISTAGSYTDDERADHELDFDHSLLGGGVTAADVSIVDAANDFTATDVEAALAELQSDAETHAATENAHGMEHNDLNAVGANDHHNQSHGNGDHTTAFTDDTVVNAHLVDAGDAHDASAISILDAANDFTATDVEGALAELQSDAEAHFASLAAHSAEHTTFDDTGLTYVFGVEVQGALAAVDGALVSLAGHLTDGGDAHDASAISFVPNGSIAATDVQAAIQEVRDEAGGGSVTYAGAFKFS